MSFHHARTIHGSRPNRSTQRRAGCAIQAYAPSGTRQVLGENLWMPVRGDFMADDFVELQRPRADMDAAAAGERERANRNWAQILYHGANQKRNY